LPGATITYTSTDVAAGVIDCRTGAALLSAATGTFAVSGVTSFMGVTGQYLTPHGSTTASGTAPIAIAPYAYWQWAGDGSSLDDGNNPAALRHTNYELQHRTAILCDYVIELPLVPASTGSTSLGAATTVSGTSYANFANTLTGPVADNTIRTPMAFTGGSASTVFVNQVTSSGNIAFAGDWAVNPLTGTVSAYAVSGVTTGITCTYYNYASAPSAVSAFASAVGNLKAGDFVKCDANSNWTLATPPSQGGTDGFDVIMGQVIEVENVYNKDALGLVRTAFANLSTSAAGTLYQGALQSNPNTLGTMDQMPGSANGGVTDKVAYAGAADLVVRINLISR